MEKTSSTVSTNKRSPFNPLEGCAWPDPDPTCGTGLQVNDVSGMSLCTADSVVYPCTKDDVVNVVERAIRDKKRITCRGTQHSMGGHCTVEQGIIMDTRYLNHVEYNAAQQTITCGVGCTWANVIQTLNRHGKSVATLQSYCNFSVGGTVSANAHGITSDETLAESVVQFQLVKHSADRGVQVVTCSKQACEQMEEGSDLSVGEELFKLVIGGYGLFGVITEVTLRTADNVDLVLDSLSMLSVVSTAEEEQSEFERIWDACRRDPAVDIKLARLNILTLKTASLYVFRRDCAEAVSTTTSQLSLQPKEMSKSSKLLYKWALPILKEYRLAAEESSGQALDMPMHGAETTRNDVLWESALPLAKLYSPLVLTNDTFVLQEFFVPHDRFADWIRAARPIYMDIDVYQKHGTNDVPAQSLILLNTTIRFVEQDDTTFLSYSRCPGSYAFVLYYRIKRLKQADHDLGVFHNRLAEVAVRLGGTFYLPYRKCYSSDLLLSAYPQITEFARRKEKYDPLGLFSNAWFEEYVLPLCSDSYQSRWQGGSQSQIPTTVAASAPRPFLSREEFMAWLPRKGHPLLERRTGSYRSLLRDKSLREQFSEMFLVNIFNIADPSEVMRVMSRAASDPRNGDDSIFNILREHFHGSSKNAVSGLKQGWRAVQQLSRQKTEFTHETAKMLHNLGWFGRVRQYLSVGDHGKTIRSFRAAGLLDRSNEVKVFVAHDFCPDTDEISLSVVLERGAMEPVGDIQIQYDYRHDDAATKLSVIPSISVDLVTLNQGLHHFPPSRLYDFLLEVRRVLKAGGLFIFREHDLRLETIHSASSSTSAPVAMLDLAHSVFNAVTGVAVLDEADEIRAFRPRCEWRSMMEMLGFTDTMQSELERGDPTFDFMLCFRRSEAHEVVSRGVRPQPCSQELDAPLPDSSENPMMAMIRTLLSQVPSAVTSSAALVISKLLEGLPLVKDELSRFLLVDVPRAVLVEQEKRRNEPSHAFAEGMLGPDVLSSLSQFLANFLGNKMDKLAEICKGAEDLLLDISVREASDIAGLLSTPELWLILPLLKRRMIVAPNEVGELEKAVLDFLETHFPILLQARDVETKSHASDEDTKPRRFTPEDSVQFDSPVDSSEILMVILMLGENIPGLLDPSVVLVESGLTLSQQSALVGALAAADLPGFAENVARYHDQHSWQELRSTLIGDETPSVLSSTDLPTKERLFSKALSHPWQHTLIAFLKGPRVQLKQQALFGLRMLKMADLIALYEEAKAESASERSRLALNGDLASNLPRGTSRTLQLHTDHILSVNEPREVNIQFSDASLEYDLFDVAEVLEARYGYKSLTSSLTDVTSNLRQLHGNVQRQLASERAGKSNRRVGAAKWTDGSSTAPVGWLPIRMSLLDGFRNKGGAAKLGDSMRRVVVSTGTLGLGGTQTLKLKYVPLQTPAAEPGAVDQICGFVRDKQLVQEDLHRSDGHFTWFKLSEWMQVEIMDLFCKSLEHTPWYHFPFMEFMATYFRVLFEECKIVAAEHGLIEAYASSAFATDFIPGLVMAFVFAQLKILGYPLKLSLPMYNPEVMLEEILMTASLPSDLRPLDFLREAVDERIRDATLLCRPGTSNSGLYRMEVPTFKAMGEILVKLGECIPSARLLQISNQKVVQTLLSIEFDEPSETDASQAYLQHLAAEIECLEGLTVALQFRYPMDVQLLREDGELQARTVQLAVKASVTSLLSLVRLVARHDRVRLKQIFDFWSG